jgi:hypothetical protein
MVQDTKKFACEALQVAGLKRTGLQAANPPSFRTLQRLMIVLGSSSYQPVEQLRYVGFESA